MQRRFSAPHCCSPLLFILQNLNTLIGDFFHSPFFSSKYILDDDDDYDYDDQDEENKSDTQPSQFLCGICFDEKPLSERFREGRKCKHPFCTDCISKYVATQMQQNIIKVRCPDPKCSVELIPRNFNTILPREVIDRWESARCESLIAQSKKTYCPYKDCSVLLVKEGWRVVTCAECPYCRRLFCAKCKVPWHGGRTCKDFKNGINDSKDLDKKFFELAKKEAWKKCPKCNVFVQKADGCSRIICRCGCTFCYSCGAIFKAYLDHVFCNKIPSRSSRPSRPFR